MLRTLALLLVLANALFFAWGRGWLAPAVPAPRHAESEPERLAAQLRPELISVLPAAAASAAAAASRAARLRCLEAGPFADEAAAAAAEAALAEAALPAGSWARLLRPAAPQWWLVLGRYADAAARNARAAELKKQGLDVEPLDAPPALAPGLRLSRHDSAAAAQAALAALPAALRAGPRAASVVERPAPPPALWLRAAQAEPELQSRLRALGAPALGAGFRDCTPAAPAGAASGASAGG